MLIPEVYYLSAASAMPKQVIDVYKLNQQGGCPAGWPLFVAYAMPLRVTPFSSPLR